MVSAVGTQYWKTAKTTHLTAVADAESGFLAWAMSGHLAGKEGDFDTSAPPQVRCSSYSIS